MMSQPPAQPGAAAPQQPVYQPMYVEHRSPEYLRPLASDFLLVLGAILGIFLMMLGSLIWGMTSNNSAIWDLGKAIAAFGTFLITAVLLMGAFVRSDADKVVRAAYVIAAALILGLVGFW